MTRAALLVTHTGRSGAITCAQQIALRLQQAGFAVLIPENEASQVGISDAVLVSDHSAVEANIVIALGGDGTFLRAAEFARPAGAPLLGINLGHVGFLAEVEADHFDAVVTHIVAEDYDVEERLALAADIYDAKGTLVGQDWALNEVLVEKAVSQRMAEVRVSIDGSVISQWGCDGVLCATPTGSTAYALSAGGPVVWPQVEALLVVPVSAHALFNRSLVAPPSARIHLEVLPSRKASVAFDGRRSYALDRGGRVEVRRSEQPVRVVRLAGRSFSERLVAKFGLDVTGFRGI